MAAIGEVRLEMRSIADILQAKGLSLNGDIQKFHDSNVLRRIQRYMPYRTGQTIHITVAQTVPGSGKIITATPYARRIYKGVTENGTPLNYMRDKNPKAGPYWDRALAQAEGRQLTAELQRYIKRKEGAGQH